MPADTAPSRRTRRPPTGAVNPEFAGDQAGTIDPAEHLRLCHMMVGRMIRPREDPDDLLSAAQFGLVKAARNFDPARNIRFSTYACTVIAREIVCARHGSRRIDVKPRSLGDDAGKWIAGTRGLPEADARHEREHAAAVVAELEQALTPVQMLVARRRVAGEPLHAIAADLGITKERVRQIERDATNTARALHGFAPRPAKSSLAPTPATKQAKPNPRFWAEHAHYPPCRSGAKEAYARRKAALAAGGGGAGRGAMGNRQ